MSKIPSWSEFRAARCGIPELGLTLEISRMHCPAAFFEQMTPAIQAAFQAMDALEHGAIANPDEKRMVGHYWLRAPELAPSPELTFAIRDALAGIKIFARRVHSGQIRPPRAERFTQLLLVGIGGSALGPMFVRDALAGPADRMTPHFLDNTDPEGFERVLVRLRARLPETLVLVISKSGGTPEPRNAMLVAADAFREAGLNFAAQAVAITGAGSMLDRQAERDGWLARFPMWDWVGGRTSETGPVGLLPAALQGLAIDDLLAGAAACDRATRIPDLWKNPAALMALMWFFATEGRGRKDMVILPYKDRLLLLSRYLQQLIMESLGKRLDRSGAVVEQGISVYGNKGSTDQHAYVQQLRDGINNFFAIFIRVLEDGGSELEVEPGITAGDYLHGFWYGTREALTESGRQSMTLTVPRVDARTVGALIALFERAVGLYAELIGINAYDQPGVEAGKKAAAAVLELQSRIVASLSTEPRTAEQIAAMLGADVAPEAVYAILEHLAANRRAGAGEEADPAARRFALPQG